MKKEDCELMLGKEFCRRAAPVLDPIEEQLANWARTEGLVGNDESITFIACLYAMIRPPRTADGPLRKKRSNRKK